MTDTYTSVQWNPFKKSYDRVLLLGVLGYLVLFVVGGKLLHPGGEHFDEPVLLIRALGTCAFLLLHIALAIGPLARLDRRWLPLLYNRRHLGVTTCVLGLLHSALTTLFYGGFGVKSPLAALLGGYDGGGTLSGFPFEVLGFGALSVMFLLAATSHDFWLANLGASTWKAIHMAVYPAYALLVGHVALGALQSERHPALAGLVGLGALTLTVLHLAAAFAERRRDGQMTTRPAADGWIDAAAAADVPDGRALAVRAAGGERIAIFRQGERLWAVQSVCAHQGGPLAEGRLTDGCITCPWHGYQYQPEDGRSPPPFTERIPTHELRVVDGRVHVRAEPLPPGTARDSALHSCSESRS
ncbi:MAG: (2Fe-2S)-binding protein [Planctomycetota bacterium]|nr:MAG: (2Fe-2S)-binding protein [Planctomycetota bacterium]